MAVYRSLIMALLILWNAVASSQTLLIESPTASDIEYLATLKSQPELRSPTEDYKHQHPSPAARAQVLKLFTEAQKAFVSSSTEESRKQFEKVLELKFQDDWSKTERLVFFHSELRLAQLESNAEAQDSRLRAALMFAHDLKADAGLFPPPLLKRFTQIADTSKPIEPNSLLGSGLWREVLINGQVCTRTNCRFRMQTQVPVRLTYLSDKWRPQTKVMTLAEQNPSAVQRQALVTGQCSDFKFDNHLAQRNAKLLPFFALTCPPALKTEQAPNLQIVSEESSPPNPTHALEAGLNSTVQPREVQSGRFYQSKWFWIGLGSVVTAAIIIQNQQQRSQPPEEQRVPTTTYGN